MDQTFWLTDAVIAKRSTAGELAKQFSIPRNTLHRLVSHARKNKVMKGSDGRPGALDAESQADIKHNIEASLNHNLYVGAQHVAQLVATEERNTAARRRCPRDSFHRMSKRSMNRYVDYFMAFKELTLLLR
jgi:hypothetical protein